MYSLQKGDGDLHDIDSSGLQYTQAPAVAGAVEEGVFDLIDESAGPGMSVKKFLPKGSLAWESIRASLQPSVQSKALLADSDGRYLKVREKRLAAALQSMPSRIASAVGPHRRCGAACIANTKVRRGAATAAVAAGALGRSLKTTQQHGGAATAVDA